MAARKKSTSDVVADEHGVSEEPKDFKGFFAGEPPEAPKAVEASLAEHIGGAFKAAAQGAARFIEQHGPDVPAPSVFYAHPDTPPDVVEELQAFASRPRITKLQLHTRAHILGIQGTSDSLVVGDVIESIEPDMLGPIPGFVVRLKRGAPVFMPQASVLAVTVMS